jgi:hypothetical protein
MLHKHVVASRADRLPALAVEITRLEHPDGSIPIVATTHADRIRVAYRWPGQSSWKGVDIAHRGIPEVLYDGPFTDYFDLLSRQGYSARIAVAASADRVFVVFKRRVQLSDGTRPTGLWIAVLTAQGNELVLQTQDPVRFPFPAEYQRSGFHLAALYDRTRNHLVVITQAYKPNETHSDLLMFATGQPDGDLSVLETWQWRMIGSGGWDLDAIVADGVVHCLYRRSPYATEMSAPWPVSSGEYEIAELNADTLDYGFLNYVRVPSDFSGPSNTMDALPGGNAPRIQNANPFAYTCERWSAGSIRFGVASNPFGVGVNNIRLLEFAATRRGASLFWRGANDWKHAKLMESDEASIAHSPRETRPSWIFDDAILYLPVPDFFALGTLRPRCSIACTRFERVAGGRIEADLLHPRADIGALVLARIELSEQTPSQEPALNRFGVVDLNHGAIPAPRAIVPQGVENDAFSRLTRERQSALSQLNDDTLSFVTTWRPEQRLDYRVARDVVVSRPVSSLPDLAYVHAGDDGSRAAFSARLDSIPAIAHSPETLDPRAVGGSLYADTRWVSISAAPGAWTAYNLAAESAAALFLGNGSLFTGRDTLIYSLFTQASLAEEGSSWDGVLTNDNRLALELRHVRRLQEWLAGVNPDNPGNVTWLPLPTLNARAETGGHLVQFSCPVRLFRGQMSRFDATGSFLADADQSQVTYVWEFTGLNARGDRVDTVNLTVQQPIVSVSLASAVATRYTVRLILRGAGTESSTILEDVEFGPALWDEIWLIRDRLNQELRSQTPTIGDVGPITLRASQYAIEWRMDGLSRSQWIVTLDTNFGGSRLGGRYRFLGNPAGQGQVELRFPIEIILPRPVLTGLLGALVRVSAVVRLNYQRAFAPALLTRDERSAARQGPGIEAVWTMKPTRNATSNVDSAEVNMNWTVSGAMLLPLIALLVEVLLGVGLFALAGLIAGMWATIVALASSIFGIIAAVILTGVLVGVLLTQVLPAVEGVVEGQIRANDFTENLNESGLLTDAGEGLAEALAVRLLVTTPGTPPPEPVGRNRNIRGLWGLVYVTETECRVQRAVVVPPGAGTATIDA